MTVTSSKAFREEVLRQLHFQPSDRGHCTLFRDSSLPKMVIFCFIPVLVIMSWESQIIQSQRIFRSGSTTLKL